MEIEEEGKTLSYFKFNMFLDSSLILSVNPESFASILTSKYIDRAMGKPTLVIRFVRVGSITYPIKLNHRD